MYPRVNAASIHLCISVLVASLVLFLMLGLWYPEGYFKLMGGGGLLFLMTGIDICLGPLLTLAVFNRAKKSLKFDLAIIGVLQLSALLYGANVMFKVRPVFNVLEEDRFKVATAADFLDDKELIQAKKPEWRRLSLIGPVLVAALRPTDISLKRDITLAAAAGMDWNMFPKLYVDYESQRMVALKNAKSLMQLKKVTVANVKVINSFLIKKGKPQTEFVYLPIYSRMATMSAILDSKTAELIDIVDAKPQ